VPDRLPDELLDELVLDEDPFVSELELPDELPGL
jgi:hypothetical protein